MFSKEFTKELVNKYSELADAFIDVMDGISVNDLRAMTGMSEERCVEIISLYGRILQTYCEYKHIAKNV